MLLHSGLELGEGHGGGGVGVLRWSVSGGSQRRWEEFRVLEAGGLVEIGWMWKVVEGTNCGMLASFSMVGLKGGCDSGKGKNIEDLQGLAKWYGLRKSDERVWTDTYRQ